MKLFAEVNTRPSRAELVKFGLVLLAAGALAAAYFYFARGDARAAAWPAAIGLAVFVVSLVPVLGRPVYVVWMSLGVLLGRVTSPIVLFVIYALLVVPVGIAFRLRGRDTMKRRRDENADSYWEDYPRAESAASYLRQS